MEYELIKLPKGAWAVVKDVINKGTIPWPAQQVHQLVEAVNGAEVQAFEPGQVRTEEEQDEQ